VREYADKKKRAGGKLVDSTPQLEKELQNELDKVAKAYGGGAGVDMAKFPEFKFNDPKLDDIDLK
jgi:F-type H+-transporting ATPase subunit 6